MTTSQAPAGHHATGRISWTQGRILICLFRHALPNITCYFCQIYIVCIAYIV